MSGQRARVPYPPSPPSPPSRNYRHALAGLRAAPHESAPLAAPARLRASGSGEWRDATCARGPTRTEEASGVGRVRVRVSRGGEESGGAGLGRIRRPRGAAAAGGVALPPRRPPRRSARLAAALPRRRPVPKPSPSNAIARTEARVCASSFGPLPRSNSSHQGPRRPAPLRISGLRRMRVLRPAHSTRIRRVSDFRSGRIATTEKKGTNPKP